MVTYLGTVSNDGFPLGEAELLFVSQRIRMNPLPRSRCRLKVLLSLGQIGQVWSITPFHPAAVLLTQSTALGIWCYERSICNFAILASSSKVLHSK